MHFNSELEDVIKALTLSLGHVDGVTPNIYPVASHENGVGIGIFVHGGLKELSQVLLMSRVLDDGDGQRIMVAEVACLPISTTEALDLLNVVDFEFVALDSRMLGALKNQGDKHGPLAVSMDAAAGVAFGEGGQEKRRAL